jgi:hypothetical protein
MNVRIRQFPLTLQSAGRDIGSRSPSPRLAEACGFV